MEKELDYLGRVINNPEHPFVAILGGAKVSDKIPVINALIDRGVDKILIGGAMAYTFLKAEGFTVGKSLVEDNMLQTHSRLRSELKRRELRFCCRPIIRWSIATNQSKASRSSRKQFRSSSQTSDWSGMDIGVETVAHLLRHCEDARTIIWNGPMGVFEEPPFDQGTIGVARAVAEAADRGAIVIVGGGDSVSAVTRAGVADRITHISTGGGATLEFWVAKNCRALLHSQTSKNKRNLTDASIYQNSSSHFPSLRDSVNIRLGNEVSTTSR